MNNFDCSLSSRLRGGTSQSYTGEAIVPKVSSREFWSPRAKALGRASRRERSSIDAVLNSRSALGLAVISLSWLRAVLPRKIPVARHQDQRTLR